MPTGRTLRQTDGIKNILGSHMQYCNYFAHQCYQAMHLTVAILEAGCLSRTIRGLQLTQDDRHFPSSKKKSTLMVGIGTSESMESGDTYGVGRMSARDLQ